MSKKGSLELSIQAIVIIVIAFVVLGLGLGFVRGQFKSISDTSSSVQEQIRQQILEDLRTGNKRLSFPATSLQIAKGESTDIAIGVKNNLAAGTLEYTIKVATTCRKGDDPCATSGYSDVNFFYDLTTEYELAQTESNIHPIKITAEGEKGNYLVKLSILTGTGIYADKTFFVTII